LTVAHELPKGALASVWPVSANRQHDGLALIDHRVACPSPDFS